MFNNQGVIGAYGSKSTMKFLNGKVNPKSWYPEPFAKNTTGVMGPSYAQMQQMRKHDIANLQSANEGYCNAGPGESRACGRAQVRSMSDQDSQFTYVQSVFPGANSRNRNARLKYLMGQQAKEQMTPFTTWPGSTVKQNQVNRLARERQLNGTAKYEGLQSASQEDPAFSSWTSFSDKAQFDKYTWKQVGVGINVKNNGDVWMLKQLVGSLTYAVVNPKTKFMYKFDVNQPILVGQVIHIPRAGTTFMFKV